MDTIHQFKLGFLTDQNAVSRMMVSRAKPSATSAQITAAMTAMINSGALRFIGGDPMFPYDAELITTERSAIQL